MDFEDNEEEFLSDEEPKAIEAAELQKTERRVKSLLIVLIIWLILGVPMLLVRHIANLERQTHPDGEPYVSIYMPLAFMSEGMNYLKNSTDALRCTALGRALHTITFLTDYRNVDVLMDSGSTLAEFVLRFPKEFLEGTHYQK